MSDWALGHGKPSILSWTSQDEHVLGNGETISCPQSSLPPELSLSLGATRYRRRNQAATSDWAGPSALQRKCEGSSGAAGAVEEVSGGMLTHQGRSETGSLKGRLRLVCKKSPRRPG